MKQKTIVRLNSSKEDMTDQFSEGLGLDYDHPIMDQLKYALYEVEFELDVDLETGNYDILKVDGQELRKHEDEELTDFELDLERTFINENGMVEKFTLREDQEKE